MADKLVLEDGLGLVLFEDGSPLEFEGTPIAETKADRSRTQPLPSKATDSRDRAD